MDVSIRLTGRTVSLCIIVSDAVFEKFPIAFTALFDCIACIALGHQLSIILYLCIPPMLSLTCKSTPSLLFYIFLKELKEMKALQTE
jgi:hypothetical protein